MRVAGVSVKLCVLFGSPVIIADHSMITYPNKQLFASIIRNIPCLRAFCFSDIMGSSVQSLFACFVVNVDVIQAVSRQKKDD
jgi:hypothetical protein